MSIRRTATTASVRRSVRSRLAVASLAAAVSVGAAACDLGVGEQRSVGADTARAGRLAADTPLPTERAVDAAAAEDLGRSDAPAAGEDGVGADAAGRIAGHTQDVDRLRPPVTGPAPVVPPVVEPVVEPGVEPIVEPIVEGPTPERDPQPEPGFAPRSKPQSTVPAVVTEPVPVIPATTVADAPPVTQPVVEPPATLPPASETPATMAPVTMPPMTVPPMTVPPMTVPPLTMPPVTMAPATTYVVQVGQIGIKANDCAKPGETSAFVEGEGGAFGLRYPIGTYVSASDYTYIGEPAYSTTTAPGSGEAWGNVVLSFGIGAGATASRTLTFTVRGVGSTTIRDHRSFTRADGSSCSPDITYTITVAPQA